MSHPKSVEIGPVPFETKQLLQSQWVKPVYPTLSLKGQTALVTGCNIGIGLAACEWFLQLGVARLIMAVRTPSKGEDAAAGLRKTFHSATVDVWQVDMLSYSSIQQFADKCSGLDRLDVAVLNAGAFNDKFELGPSNHEAQLQVNYLSTSLLAFLLLPILKSKSPIDKPGRLTVVSSGSAWMGKFPQRLKRPILPEFDNEAQYNLDPMDYYCNVKLLGHFWIQTLAERVSKEDVIVNLVDPGMCKGTGLHRSANMMNKIALSIAKMTMGRSPHDSASALIDAAVVQGSESHGSYLMDWKIMQYHALAYGEEGKAIADQLWDETMAELSFADIERILNSLSSS